MAPVNQGPIAPAVYAQFNAPNPAPAPVAPPVYTSYAPSAPAMPYQPYTQQEGPYTQQHEGPYN
ncbi:hypothetical protein KIPB_006148, partial [Kipferlia bialata]|eukprot:g6148.t1